MRRSIWKRIEEILKKHVLHGKWIRAVIALACVVIYITTYVLIMPAVTMARATDCGQEEHTHSGDCYETETELTCGREEHTHTEDCYDEEGNLICGMEEHVHDDSCYTSREVLVCGQEEHVHTEDCYAEEEPVQEDIQEEAEEQEEFTVENEEEQPQAGDTVMEPAGTAAPEQLSQIRFRDYLTDWTTLYYAPEDGDNWQPLAEDKWHSLYKDNWGIRSDTADRGLDPEEYVLLHIGYRIPAGQINATNPEAEFILPLSINMTEEEVRDNNKYYYSLFSGTDREADELFVDGEYEIKEEWNSDGEVTQRKLVITFNEDACLRCGGEKLTDGTETLAAEELEGFFELRVKAEDLLTLEKKSESAYVLEWNDEEDLDTIIHFDPEKLAAYYDAKNGDSTETDAEKPVPGELRAEGEDYTITVSYTEEAGLPAGAALKVKEITKEEDEEDYESYKARVEEELIDSESAQVTGARFFDITLEDSEGNVLHPEGNVTVRIETGNIPKENENVRICHFDGEEGKPVDVESRKVSGETGEEENLGVEFEAESFSVYGIFYTTDAYAQVLSASDNTYEITVTCGEDAKIPKGAELNVREILQTDEEYADLYSSAVVEGCSDAENQGIEMPILSAARLFDIEIRGKEGKIEPSAPVQVSIRLIGTAAADHTAVVHFGEDEVETLTAETTEIQMPETQDAETQDSEDVAQDAAASETTDSAANEADGTAVTEVSFQAEAFSVYSVVNVTDFSSLTGSDKKYALVSGISGDPGATTGYSETWGRDYFTIIVNAHALSDQHALDDQNRVNGLQVDPVHAYEDGSISYVGGSPAQWQFVSAGNGKYYLSANGKYLQRFNKGGDNRYGWEAQLVDNISNATPLSITVNNDGTILIYDDSVYGRFYLHNDGGGANNEWQTRVFKFTNQNVDTNSPAFRFRVCEESDQYDSFAARKVSVQDLSVNDNFLIYRKFEDSEGNEQLYALASDGTFVRVYDGGDTVYWRETDKNIYWNFRMEGGYYSIYSTDPAGNETVYINPMHSSDPPQTITSAPSRLTLIGKDNGDYGTTIENWDQTAYDYAGLHVTLNDQGEPVLSTGTRVAGTSDIFRFAVASQMPGAAAETVDTVDSEAMGIHITVFDYGRDDFEYNAGDKLDSMAYVVSSNRDTANRYQPHQANALVKPYLEDGLPSGTTTGAMEGLFTADGSAVTYSQSGVTNLFLKSYYDESGMFRYRSEDNFAYLGKGGNTSFTVYRQAATPYPYDTQPGHTYYTHGHYMPFNDIDMTKNVSRLMNQYGNEYTNSEVVGELPVGDGRTYEDIYGTQGTPNFFTGMKMEADFTQLKDGRLDNGDPMVFKFTGDDDMWVYIDGVLVLDIGGIHEPLSGTIDFATGEVNNPTGSSLAGKKTLYDIFMQVKDASGTPQPVKDKIESITWKDVNNDGRPDTFADYTNHEFKAFYMERGAGASNLDIQFNLKVLRPGEVVVEKQLPDGVDPRFVNQEYKFQALFKDYTDNDSVHPLNKDATYNNGENVCAGVYYRDRKDDGGNPVEVPVDENGYFTLKAGEAAVFMMADKKIEYTINEVEIDTDQKTEQVEINDQVVEVSGGTAAAAYARVGDRSHLNYKNHPYLQNLNIVKHILPEGAEYDLSDVFEFRVYLETLTEEDGEEVRQLVPYSYGPYYVTKADDHGAIHYYTLTGENNAPQDQGTNPVVCSTTGRSGSINSIPPEYTVVIPNLAVGTHFYIEERRDNIPAGYVFDHEDLVRNEDYDYDDQTLGTDEAIISRILARDEKDHQEFDHNTIGKIKKGKDAKSEVFNRKANVNVQKQWLKMNGKPYTLEQARQLPGSTGAVITAELWRKKIIEDPSGDSQEPVTVTFMVNTTEDAEYRQVSVPLTIRNDSTLEFSLGARGTSQAQEIHSDPSYTISRSSVSSDPKITYSNGRQKDKWSKYTISGITDNITVYATFDAEKVSDDFVGLYIASMEEPGASETAADEKVADITLTNANDWTQQINMEQGYTYFLMNVAETGLEGDSNQYTFISEPTVTTDDDGNLILAVANKYREPINVTVEKRWSPQLTSEEESTAHVTVELHRYAKKTKGVLDVVLKDNYGAPIEGAVFKLYKDGEAQEQDYVTDINGKVAANNLEPGTYYFKQISTPEAYSMPDPNPQTEAFVVEDNKTVPQEKHCELQNQALQTNGVATLTLLDNTGAPIRGATYSLIKNEGSQEEVLKEGLLTDENGQIVVSQLKAGTYHFFETATPPDYILPSSWQDTSFTVLERPGAEQRFNISMTNNLRGKGYVEVTLTGPDGQPVGGAGFELYQGTEKLAEATTGSDGKLTFGDPDRLTAGSYIVKQVTSDAELLPTEAPVEFSISDNGETNQKKEVSFSNTYRGKGTATVTLTRKDNNNPISGATFRLYKDGILFDTKVTDSNGQLTFGDPDKLTAGSYSIEQVDTAEGLERVKTNDIFDIAENGDRNQTHSWNVQNDTEAGNVTIRLWRKQGLGQYNWTLLQTYNNLKPGQTYSFTATLDQNAYNQDAFRYNLEEIDSNLNRNIGENDVTRLSEGGTWDSSSSTYHFTITPEHDNTTYSYTLITFWGEQTISSITMDESNGRSAASAAPKTRQLSFAKAPAQEEETDQSDAASADPGAMTEPGETKGGSATRDVPAVVNPSSPPSDDYIDDSEFKETYTLTKTDNWEHVFPNLDRYDNDENPYYYYVVEKECVPESYHIASYDNDNLTETGTITVTNTYEAEGTLDISAAKLFKGGALGGDDNTQFTFRLTQVTDHDSTIQATENVILAEPEEVTTMATSGNTAKVDFSTIHLAVNPEVNQTGVYWFMLEEVVPQDVDANGIKDGIKYDQTKKWIQVTVTDNRDGTLEISKAPAETDGVDGTWTNEQLTDVHANKVWLDMNGEALSNAPDGATVVFTLYENGTKTQKTVELDGTVDENGEYEAWHAVFKDLPRVDADGESITYTVVETRGFPEYKQVIVTTDGEGHTTITDADGNTPVSDNETIYNQKIRIIRARKQWKDKGGNLIGAPAGATSTITLYKLTEGDSSINKEQVGNPVVLDGTTDENGEEEAWVATFRNLEADADYIVEESGLTDGFELVGIEAEVAANTETKDFWVKTNRLTEGMFLIVGDPYALQNLHDPTQGETINSLKAPDDSFKFVLKKRTGVDGFDLYKDDGTTRLLNAYEGWTYENNVMKGFCRNTNEYYYLDLSRKTSVPQPLGNTSGKPVDIYRKYTVPASGDYTFVVTNQQKKTELGSLVITKKVFLGADHPDVNAPEKTYTFGIFSAPYQQGDAPVRTAEFSVTGSEGSTTVLNLDYGNYVVYELDDQGNPVTGANATIGGIYYKVEYSNTDAVAVDSGNVPEIEVSNTVETVSLEGTKTWDIIGTALPADPILTLTRISAKPGSGPETVKDSENQNLQPVWSDVTGETNKRKFVYDDLPKYDAEGYEYTYSVSEAMFTVDDQTYTVTKENDTYIVKIGDEATPAFVVTQDNQNNITNTEKKEFSFEKEWYYASQAAVTWPKDDQGNDIPIVITITGKKTGAEDIVITKTLTSAEPAADAGYTVTKDEFNAYKFTFTGLENDYEYQVSEATIDGYHVEYYLKTSEKQLSGVNWTDDGGTIRNILTMVELPHSGGPGTTPFTSLGAMLIALAGAALVWMRKRRREQVIN